MVCAPVRTNKNSCVCLCVCVLQLKWSLSVFPVPKSLNVTYNTFYFARKHNGFLFSHVWGTIRRMDYVHEKTSKEVIMMNFSDIFSWEIYNYLAKHIWHRELKWPNGVKIKL